MTDRAYTVVEIDRMRYAVDHVYMLGYRVNEAPPQSGVSRSYDEPGRTTCVEELLRTYMLAGIGPEELEGPPRTPEDEAVIRTQEIASGQTVTISG